MTELKTVESDNQEPEGASRRKILAMATSLGRTEGAGSNSRPGLFLVTCEGAKQHVVGADDVTTLVQNFSKGYAEKQNIGWQPMSSEAQQVSKLKQAIYLGELTHVDGLEVAQRAAKLLAQARLQPDTKPSDYKPPFDALVDVARVQVNHQPEVPLSDEQLMAIMAKPAKELEELADRLGKIADAIDKIVGDENVGDKTTLEMLERIKTPLVTRIAELGGTTKEKKAKKREADKAGKVIAAFVALPPALRHVA